MKILKINTSFFALLIGFAMVFGFSAFKSQKKTPVTYAYKLNSSNPVHYQNPSNWEIPTEESPSCNEGDERPCRVSYDGDFNTFVQTADMQDLLNIATATKD